MDNGTSAFLVTAIIIGVIWLVLVLSALWNISRSNRAAPVKILWYIIIILAPFLGSIIYWVWGKNKSF